MNDDKNDVLYKIIISFLLASTFFLCDNYVNGNEYAHMYIPIYGTMWSLMNI